MKMTVMSDIQTFEIPIENVSKLWLYHARNIIKRGWFLTCIDAPFVLAGPLTFYIEPNTAGHLVSAFNHKTKVLNTFQLPKDIYN